MVVYICKCGFQSGTLDAFKRHGGRFLLVDPSHGLVDIMDAGASSQESTADSFAVERVVSHCLHGRHPLGGWLGSQAKSRFVVLDFLQHNISSFIATMEQVTCDAKVTSTKRICAGHRECNGRDRAGKRVYFHPRNCPLAGMRNNDPSIEWVNYFVRCGAAVMAKASRRKLIRIDKAIKARKDAQILRFVGNALEDAVKGGSPEKPFRIALRLEAALMALRLIQLYPRRGFCNHQLDGPLGDSMATILEQLRMLTPYVEILLDEFLYEAVLKKKVW